MTRDELLELLETLELPYPAPRQIMEWVDEHVNRETEAAYRLGYRQDVSYFARATRSFRA